MTGGFLVWAGAGAGLVAGLGMWLVFVRLPVMRRPRLDQRLAPYVRDVARPSSLLRETAVATPFAAIERMLGPVMFDAVRLGGAALGSDRARFAAGWSSWDGR